MDVVVSMPDQVARQWGDDLKAIGRHVVDAVIERYRAGRLSPSVTIVAASIALQ